jgi:hypothetical protein
MIACDLLLGCLGFLVCPCASKKNYDNCCVILIVGEELRLTFYMVLDTALPHLLE